MADCLIGLGSNVGDRAAQLDQAIRLIADSPRITLGTASTFHPTSPVGGPTRQEPFLNAALRVTTDLLPEELFGVVRQVERALGRVRTQRWGPRRIDIDLLLYDQLILQNPDLTIPHPRMAIRRFVLEPACEVASEMIHAPTGWTLQTLLDRLDRRPYYVAVCCADARRSRHLVALAMERIPARRLSCEINGLGFVALSGPGAEADQLRNLFDSLASQLTALPTESEDPRHEGILISDYWINQLVAVARTWSPGPKRRTFERTWRQASRRLVQPHFVLHLELSVADPGSANTAASGGRTADEDNVPDPRLSALAEQLRQEVSQPGCCPVLSVSSHDLDLALTELQAGIDAMR